MSQAIDPRELRRAFGTFATGVAIVTGVSVANEPVGLTVNSLTSVSLDPPMLLWCISDRSANVGAFVEGRAFNVNILGEGQGNLALHFARPAQAKFHVDPDWKRAPSPPPIEGALAVFACRVAATYAGGDHVIVLGAIEAVTMRAGEPLVFHGGAFGVFQGDQAIPRLLPDPGGGDGWL
jgi:flavin reductase (DIM6/NTAB) family NADH-FMN oxidoreductase RutF